MKRRRPRTTGMGSREMRRWSYTGGIFLLVALAAGCGSSTASKVTAAAQKQYAARSVSCVKAGAMAVAGGRSVVYDCTLSGVDALHQAGLPYRDVGARLFNRCFVDVDGMVSDVTAVVDRLQANGLTAGGTFHCH